MSKLLKQLLLHPELRSRSHSKLVKKAVGSPWNSLY
jgi:hypothetical protein